MNEASSGGLGSYSIICLSRGLVLVDVSEDPERRALFSSLCDIVYTVTGLVLDAMLVGAWRAGSHCGPWIIWPSSHAIVFSMCGICATVIPHCAMVTKGLKCAGVSNYLACNCLNGELQGNEATRENPLHEP